MRILVAELAEYGSVMNFCILFLHWTFSVHEMRTLCGAK